MRTHVFIAFIILLSANIIGAMADEIWICPSCGNEASLNFCNKYGVANPSPFWICPKCRNEAEGNFCSNCGMPRPKSVVKEEKSANVVHQNINADDYEPVNMGFGIGCITDDGYKGIFDGHLYEIVSGGYTWSEAEKICEEKGGHLVTITTNNELRYTIMLNARRESLWIGLQKDNEKGKWKWITDEEFTISNWENGKPLSSDNSYYDDNE